MRHGCLFSRSQGQVVDALKRIAVCMITICYAFLACGLMVDAGYCRSEQTHDVNDHNSHQHAPSKLWIAMHGLSHWTPPEALPLISKHCCCVSQGESSPHSTPHTCFAPLRTPKASDSPRKLIPLEKLGVSSTPQLGRSYDVCDAACITSTRRSLNSTILLI